MFRVGKAIRTVVPVLLSVALFGQSSTPDMHFHSLVPLGAEAYDLEGETWKTMITLLASAQNPQFEGMVRRSVNQREVLFAANGEKVQNYPEQISFRVTASYRARFLDASPLPISASGDANDYLLRLQFRAVIFDGLRQTVVQPESVEMIGVPEDVPYDERVWRVAVKLPHIPLRDRVVLEVRDGDGERICKFHLDLI